MSQEDSWLPPADEESRPFFDGAREGKLVLQRCTDCDAWHFPIRSRCLECGGPNLEWDQASGRGTVYTHGLLRRSYHPRHADRLPLILAVVDLAEGVRLNTNLVDVDPADVRAGQSVEVAFETFPDGAAVPVFRPA